MNADGNMNRPAIPRSPIRNLRWWIGGALFASTVINYIDRQTLSALAPFLKKEYQWTNEDYALIVISFRVAYAIGQTALGRLMDRIGTRLGLTITVAWYSIVAMLTSFAGGLRSFAFFRFLLGLGESPNWPAATKAVAEWFPRKETGLGGRAVRQRLLHRRRDRARVRDRPLHDVRRLAPGIHRDRLARLPLDTALAPSLPSPGITTRASATKNRR